MADRPLIQASCIRLNLLRDGPVLLEKVVMSSERMIQKHHRYDWISNYQVELAGEEDWEMVVGISLRKYHRISKISIGQYVRQSIWLRS